MFRAPGPVPAAVAIAVGGVAAWLVGRRLGVIGVRAAKQRIKARLLSQMQRSRVALPAGRVSSECHAVDGLRGTSVILPAVIGCRGHILLGDYMHACALIGDVDGDTDPDLVPFFRKHGPSLAVLNCMGGIDRSMQRVYDRAGITALGLPGAQDKDYGDATYPEGYPLLAHHLKEAQAFLAAQHAAGRKVLVHCHEGKNRSACLCVAYLILTERMTLSEAVLHVFERRPVVLSNVSFVDQLIELADAERRLTSVREDLELLVSLAWIG